MVNQQGADIFAERNYGIDCLKIFSMFLVCVLHTLGHSGWLTGDATAQSEIAWLMETFAFCAVNCYALASGYVGWKKKVRYANLAYLWMQTFFWSVLIFALGCIFLDCWSIKNCIKSLLPVSFRQYWYFSAYFGMFLLMPLLNFILVQMPRKALRTSLAILLTVTLLLSLADKNVFMLSGGYSTLWLTELYLVGGYIGKYEVGKNFSKRKLWICLLGAGLFSWTARWWIGYLTRIFLGTPRHTEMFIEYTSPTVYLMAVIWLLLFAYCKVPLKMRSGVVLLSSTTFGIYLIHVHPIIYHDIYSYINFQSFSSPWLIFPAVLGIAAIIFLSCALLTYCQQFLFRVLRIKKHLVSLENKVCNRLNIGENE